MFMGCHKLLHLHLKTGMENVSGCCLTVCPAPSALPLASVSLHTDYSFPLSWSPLAWQPIKHMRAALPFLKTISYKGAGKTDPVFQSAFMFLPFADLFLLLSSHQSFLLQISTRISPAFSTAARSSRIYSAHVLEGCLLNFNSFAMKCVLKGLVHTVFDCFSVLVRLLVLRHLKV